MGHDLGMSYFYVVYVHKDENNNTCWHLEDPVENLNHPPVWVPARQSWQDYGRDVDMELESEFFIDLRDRLETN